VVHDLGTGIVRAVCVTPADAGRRALPPLRAALDRRRATLVEPHLNPAYLPRDRVRERPPELRALLQGLARARRGPFRQAGLPPRLGAAHHPLSGRAETALRPRRQGARYRGGPRGPPALGRGTTGAHGRRVHLHPDERLPHGLRRRQRTLAKVAKPPERVAVEHTLAHLGRRQKHGHHYRCKLKGRSGSGARSVAASGAMDM
jgi:hypothetical protein